MVEESLIEASTEASTEAEAMMKAPIAETPLVETPTHLYFILPVAQWPLAAQFVSNTVGPETPFPNDPDASSILAAVNRETGDIEGVLCVMQRIVVDHYAVKSSAGVSYTSFHSLLRSALPVGSVYYTVVSDSVGGMNAAYRAGLEPRMRAAMTVTGLPTSEPSAGVGVGVEGADAVGSDHSGSHQRGR